VRFLTFFALLFCFFGFIYGNTYEESRFGAHGVFDDSVSTQDKDRFFDAFLKAKNNLAPFLSPLPQELPLFFILKNLDAKTIPLWVGGWYTQEKIFLQPIAVLWGKGLLDDVVLIEYAHFIIDRKTHFLCPPWLHELLALTYAKKLKTGLKPSVKPKNKRFSSFDYYTKSQQHLAFYSYSQDFFMLSQGFSLFLTKQCGEDFFNRLLGFMHQKNSWQQSFIKACSFKAPQLYHKFFLTLP